MATVFEAQWSGGKCSECGDPIERGDLFSYTGSDLVHDECNAHSTYTYDPLMDWEASPDEDYS